MYDTTITVTDSGGNTIELIKGLVGYTWLYIESTDIAITTSSTIKLLNFVTPHSDLAFVSSYSLSFIKDNVLWSKVTHGNGLTVNTIKNWTVSCAASPLPQKNLKSTHSCTFTPGANTLMTGILKITATNITKIHCPVLEITVPPKMGTFSCSQDPSMILVIYLSGFSANLNSGVPIVMDLLISFNLVTGATLSAESWDSYTGTPPAHTATEQVLQTPVVYTFSSYLPKYFH